MKNFLFFTLLAFNIFKSEAQLVSYQKIDSFTVAQLNVLISNLGFGGFIVPEYPVDVYRIMHKTEYKNGTTEISGLLAVPKNTVCKVPLVAYQHGTTSYKLDVPSYNGGERNIVIMYASLGNVVCASDYIGLGASTENLHPYMHAYSQAHSTINLLRAVREIDSNLDFNMSNQLFLFGYSQGGFATAATVKYMETNYSDEFKVTAAAPMSGPYNMAGVQYDMLNTGLPYSVPAYLPYVVLSYQSMYGNLYNTPDELFKTPYDSTMPYFFNNHNYGLGTISNYCTPIPTDMFIDSVYEDVKNNVNHPLRLALLDNDFLSWTPQTAMKLFYCNGDDQVNYRNAEVADSVWNANGAPSIESVDNGNFTHSGCFPFAMLGGKNYLESYLNYGVEINIVFDSNTNSFTASVVGENSSDFDFVWNNGSTNAEITNVQADSTYVVTATHKTKGCSNSRSFNLEEITIGIKEIEDDFYFNIYPNPTKNKISISNIQSSKGLYIVNLLGKIVLTQTISENNALIDISKLEKGIYFVGLNGVKTKQKFVVK